MGGLQSILDILKDLPLVGRATVENKSLAFWELIVDSFQEGQLCFYSVCASDKSACSRAVTAVEASVPPTHDYVCRTLDIHQMLQIWFLGHAIASTIQAFT